MSPATGAGGRFAALHAALDGLAANGAPVPFWLRDDDAVAPSAALDRLLALADACRVPLALAVVPERAEPALAERLAPMAGVFVLQHGWSHRNHAGEGRKKSELGPGRPLPVMLAELAEGRARLAAFPRVAPILVPPWNRIDAALLPHLPALGFAALSTFGDRPTEVSGAAAALRRVDTHVDPVAWRSGRGFLGEAAVLAPLVERLGLMAAGGADRHAATGILSHHLVMDAPTFGFLADLVRALADHPAVRWLSAPDLLIDL